MSVEQQIMSMDELIKKGDDNLPNIVVVEETPSGLYSMKQPNVNYNALIQMGSSLHLINHIAPPSGPLSEGLNTGLLNLARMDSVAGIIYSANAQSDEGLHYDFINGINDINKSRSSPVKLLYGRGPHDTIGEYKDSLMDINSELGEDNVFVFLGHGPNQTTHAIDNIDTFKDYSNNKVVLDLRYSFPSLPRNVLVPDAYFVNDLSQAYDLNEKINDAFHNSKKRYK